MLMCARRLVRRVTVEGSNSSWVLVSRWADMSCGKRYPMRTRVEVSAGG